MKLVLLVFLTFITFTTANSDGRFVYFGHNLQPRINQPPNSYNIRHPILQDESLPKKIDFINAILSGHNVAIKIESSGTPAIVAEPKPNLEVTTTAAPSTEAITPATEAPSSSVSPRSETVLPSGPSDDGHIQLELNVLNISSSIDIVADELRLNQSEAVINDLVHIHMVAYYQYLAMSAYYNREDVALKGFANLYRALGADDHKRVQQMIQFQHHRGGNVKLNAINTPASQEWTTPRVSINFALELELRNRRALNHAHQLAIDHNDPHLRHFIEEELLHEQIEEISRLKKFQAHMNLVGDGLGVFMFDKDLQLVEEGEESEEEQI